MCLILFSYKQHPDLPLVVLANRDEFLARPTREAHWWEEENILAGKDLKAGGSWLGVSRGGRFAALTNVREPHNIKADAPSRGALVTDFLTSAISPEAYLDQIAAKGQAFNGFNLLVADHDSLWYYGNRGEAPQPLSPGVYGLSNALLDTPWPKLETGKEALANWLVKPNEQEAFNILQDPHIYPDERLPATGVPLEWERGLSARFIRMENYGTRCSTLLRIDAKGGISFSERTYLPEEKWVSESWQQEVPVS